MHHDLARYSALFVPKLCLSCGHLPEQDFWPRNNFQLPRQPGAYRDHFLQADFTGLIPPSKPDSFRLAENPSSERHVMRLHEPL